MKRTTNRDNREELRRESEVGARRVGENDREDTEKPRRL